MIAPILEEGATSRQVYLPEEMIMVRFDGENFSEKKYSAGNIEVKIPLNEVVFFIRKDHAICVSRNLVQSTKDMDLWDVKKIGYDTTYNQYVDDGVSKNVSK